MMTGSSSLPWLLEMPSMKIQQAGIVVDLELFDFMSLLVLAFCDDVFRSGEERKATEKLLLLR